jgi:hypothetical protein
MLCGTAISSGECPLWVKSRHDTLKSQCPLYPQKRTLLDDACMSALCAAALSAVSRITFAQTYPSRPVGGSLDSRPAADMTSPRA